MVSGSVLVAVGEDSLRTESDADHNRGTLGASIQPSRRSTTARQEGRGARQKTQRLCVCALFRKRGGIASPESHKWYVQGNLLRLVT